MTGTKLYSLPNGDTTDLLDLLQRAAPSAERDTSATEERQAATPAKRPTNTTPLDLHVLGRIRLLSNSADITDLITAKQREVIVHLALHPDGVRRDSIVTDIWPDASGPRPQNSFHATLSQLRRALRTANTVENIVTSTDGHYALNPDVVDVDLWRLRRMLHAAPKAAALTHITNLYHGELAEEVTAEWLLTPRESVRRDVLDGLNDIMNNCEIKPEDRLKILEHMRRLDRYNESVYQEIIRTQRSLGREEAIPRTVALLAASLTEIGETPTRETTALVQAR